MTSTTRRTFLRGAAGVGSATLMPKLGWAAAGAPDYLAAAGLPDGGFCLRRADRRRARVLPPAAARPRPRRRRAPRAAGGGRLRSAAGHVRARHRLRRGAGGGAAAFARGPAFLRPRRLHAGWQPALHHRERDRRGHRPAWHLGRRRRLPADRRGADRRHRPARGAADAGRAPLRGRERRHRDRPDLGAGRAQPRDDALEPRLSRRGERRGRRGARAARGRCG